MSDLLVIFENAKKAQAEADRLNRDAKEVYHRVEFERNLIETKKAELETFFSNRTAELAAREKNVRSGEENLSKLSHQLKNEQEKFLLEVQEQQKDYFRRVSDLNARETHLETLKSALNSERESLRKKFEQVKSIWESFI